MGQVIELTRRRPAERGAPPRRELDQHDPDALRCVSCRRQLADLTRLAHALSISVRCGCGSGGAVMLDLRPDEPNATG
jgi:hypothetical protein